MLKLMSVMTIASILILTYWSTVMAEEPVNSPAEPQISIRFIYSYANDLAAMRVFYSDLLGMQEQSYSNEGVWLWLVYKCAGFEFMFFKPDQPLPVVTDFSAQPGWPNGKLYRVSWSVSVPESRFGDTVRRVLESGATCAFDKPQWFQDSYWGFPVLDPMGNTVELYYVPAVTPESTVWPAE